MLQGIIGTNDGLLHLLIQGVWYSQNCQGVFKYHWNGEKENAFYAVVSVILKMNNFDKWN